jgi:small subunit ribosomal protein S20
VIKLIKGRHKSAIKAHRKSEKLRIKNRKLMNEISKLAKNIKKAADGKNAAEAGRMLSEFFSKSDKAVKLDIVHSNNAARKKSHLSRLVAGLIAKGGDKRP